MRRLALLLVCLLLVPLSAVFADSPGDSPAVIGLAVTPLVAPGTAQRDLLGHGLPASTPFPVLVFAPDGSQSAMAGHTDASGNLEVPLTPPGGFSHEGIYRAVVDLGNGSAQSALFVVGDGKPQITVEPATFSPYSALQIIGAGLPPNQAFDLVLTPANDRGDRTFPVATDSNGFLQEYIWPEQLGESFFEAGVYRAAAPSLGLSATFPVGEKPIGAVVTIDGPVLSGTPAPVHFRRYGPGRDLWAVYADTSGHVLGEMLFGVTSASGSLDASASFMGLGGGQYRFATPYDWGETTFTAIPPTPTPTETPTATPMPTATSTPTSTPTPVPPKFKKVCKRKHGKKKCKRVPVSPEP